MKIESEKCAEVFRVGPGRFTFLCAYCSEEFELQTHALDHIETHFALKGEENRNFKTNLQSLTTNEEETNIESTNQDDTKPLTEFEHVLQLSISPISFSNDFDFGCADEVKVEPDSLQREKNSAEIKQTSKQKPNKHKPKKTKQQKDWAEWGYIHQRELVECDICGIRAQKRNLKNHIQIHAEHKKIYSCSLCQKNYSAATSLATHMRQHAEARKYVCHICPNRFNTISTLNKHIFTHTGEKNYKCTICGKAFRQMSTLTVHLRVHTGEKPFHCDICNKSFTTSSSYCLHKRRHENERNFKCNSCDMSFLTNASLRVHKMLHTGERPFPCEICTAAFTSRYKLNRHNVTHTDLKPYSCRFCDLTFVHSQTRRLHERRIHNDPKISN